MKNTLYILALILLASCSLDSKSEDEIKDYREINDTEILTYLQDYGLAGAAQKSASGLYYIIEEPGTGDQPSTSSDVTVAYKGYFLNDSVFDESDAEGISFNLQGVIPGWTEGITYFKEGGSGMLFVPSHLGYGSSDYRGIPGGSVLIFEITLHSVD
jgi:FKBP-type peptidyl-prolyl cis-trans isomerase FkpA